jgi:hypothetical protein
MTAIERTAYPRFKEPLSRRELETLYIPGQGELDFVQSTARWPTHRLALLVLLKSFQNLGYFPVPGAVPGFIVGYLHAALELPNEISIGQLTQTTLYRYHSAVRAYLDVTPYTDGGQQVAAGAIQRATQTMSDPADLINAAIEELVRQRFELPAFSRLDRLVGRIRAQVNREWYQTILDRLANEDRQRLAPLLTRRTGQTRTGYALLKKTVGKAILSQIRRTRDRLRWLESLVDTERVLAGIPTARVQQFAGEAHAVSAGDLLRFRPAHRFTLLVCLLHQAKIQARDALATMLIKRMRLTHKNALEELKAIREQQQESIERLIELLVSIIMHADWLPDDAELGFIVRQQLQQAGGIEELRGHCEAITRYRGNNILPLLWNHYRQHRSSLFDIVEALDIRSTTQDRCLVEALAFLQQNRQRRATHLPADVPIDFASMRWQRLIVQRRDGGIWYDRRQLEVCVFSHLAAELQTNDLFVVGSQEYADVRQQFLPWDECEPQVSDYCETLGLAPTPEAFVVQLKNWLTVVADAVDRSFPEDGQLSFQDERPVLRRLRKRIVPPGADALRDVLSARMPPTPLLDVLAYVERLVNYTRHFGPLSGSDPKLADPVRRYIMTTFAYGCNLCQRPVTGQPASCHQREAGGGTPRRHRFLQPLRPTPLLGNR